MPFPSDCFDAVLLDSVIEHVRDPQELLLECKRVLKPGGIVYVVFPPYYGPLSGHINDYVMIPWFHLLPGWIVKKTLLSRPRKPGTLSQRDAFDVYATLNGLTILSFKRMARRADFTTSYFRVTPVLTHPGKRLVLGLVSVIKHPSRVQNLRAVLSRAFREFDVWTGLLFLLLISLSPLVFVPIAREMTAGGCKCVLTKS
jgi:SAM-dependent methyltransferase